MYYLDGREGRERRWRTGEQTRPARNRTRNQTLNLQPCQICPSGNSSKFHRSQPNSFTLFDTLCYQGRSNTADTAGQLQERWGRLAVYSISAVMAGRDGPPGYSVDTGLSPHLTTQHRLLTTNTQTRPVAGQLLRRLIFLKIFCQELGIGLWTLITILTEWTKQSSGRNHFWGRALQKCVR